MKLGLRIDVDTYRGTKLGVPALCDVLAKHNAKATFFFSVGPDNMGRHLRRLLKPAFLLKMMRSNAASLYGWDILLRGTFLPGPIIGKKLSTQIRRAFDEGHEIGLHAWDHHAWQVHIDSMTDEAIYEHLNQGFQILKDICDQAPVCSAAPGWKANETVLFQKNLFPFRYNSDCRGSSIFMPEIEGQRLTQPQIPVTLPTYDEIIGRDAITNATYNDHILSLIQPDQINVLTIHAEVEGIVCRDLFDDFLAKAAACGIQTVPCGAFIDHQTKPLADTIVPRTLSGREGWLAIQESCLP